MEAFANLRDSLRACGVTFGGLRGCGRSGLRIGMFVSMTPAQSSADSVFSFIDATAEIVADGYRWKTYDYENQPHYHFCLLNGVGGMPILNSRFS